MLAGLGLPHEGIASRASDLAPLQRRASSVKVAHQLSGRPLLSDARLNVPNPFNPPGFDAPVLSKTENEEQTAQTTATPSPLTNQQILEKLSRHFPSIGVMVYGERHVLTGGTKHLQVGQVLTVLFEGNHYDLEIVAVSPRAITFRYRDASVTHSVAGSR